MKHTKQISTVFGVSDGLTFYSCEIEGKGEGNDQEPDYAHHIVSPLYKTRHISLVGDRTSIGTED